MLHDGAKSKKKSTQPRCSLTLLISALGLRSEETSGKVLLVAAMPHQSEGPSPSSHSGSRSGSTTPRNHVHKRLSCHEDVVNDDIDYHGAEVSQHHEKKMAIRKFSQSTVSEDDVNDQQLTSKMGLRKSLGVQVAAAAPSSIPV